MLPRQHSRLPSVGRGRPMENTPPLIMSSNNPVCDKYNCSWGQQFLHFIKAVSHSAVQQREFLKTFWVCWLCYQQGIILLQVAVTFHLWQMIRVFLFVLNLSLTAKMKIKCTKQMKQCMQCLHAILVKWVKGEILSISNNHCMENILNFVYVYYSFISYSCKLMLATSVCILLQLCTSSHSTTLEVYLGLRQDIPRTDLYFSSVRLHVSVRWCIIICNEKKARLVDCSFFS